ncbi:hypothetical protein ACFL2M_01210 [Patescibacteria group bacterium]
MVEAGLYFSIAFYVVVPEELQALREGALKKQLRGRLTAVDLADDFRWINGMLRTAPIAVRAAQQKTCVLNRLTFCIEAAVYVVRPGENADERINGELERVRARLFPGRKTVLLLWDRGYRGKARVPNEPLGFYPGL